MSTSMETTLHCTILLDLQASIFVDSKTKESLSIDMRQLFLYLCKRVTCNIASMCCFPWGCSFSDSDFSFIFFGVSVSVHQSHSDCVFTFKFIIVIIVTDIFYYYIFIILSYL